MLGPATPALQVVGRLCRSRTGAAVDLGRRRRSCRPPARLHRPGNSKLKLPPVGGPWGSVSLQIAPHHGAAAGVGGRDLALEIAPAPRSSSLSVSSFAGRRGRDVGESGDSARTTGTCRSSGRSARSRRCRSECRRRAAPIRADPLGEAISAGRQRAAAAPVSSRSGRSRCWSPSRAGTVRRFRTSLRLRTGPPCRSRRRSSCRSVRSRLRSARRCASHWKSKLPSAITWSRRSLA